ncbi:hypothetical protein LJC74_07540 [Eubacteriales bacterium OttesenSCG-928-A19]|nr:hypothetical protein [Eubacteriales bacterium OttesenSCG-928-A19]
MRQKNLCLLVLCIAILIPSARAVATLPSWMQEDQSAMQQSQSDTQSTLNGNQPDVHPYSSRDQSVTNGLEPIPATLNQKMATRTGPSTAYTEDHGTLPADTFIVVYQQEMGSGVPWVMVEFERSGLPVRAYTGLKRVDVSGEIPWATQKPILATVRQETAAHFGPGTCYMPASSTVAGGTPVEVYCEENGWALIDYQYSSERRIRVWVSMDVLQYR